MKKLSKDLLMKKKKIARLTAKSFNQVYSLGRKIQKGSFGDVHRISCNEYPELVLIAKIVEKKEEKIAFHEIDILKKLEHIQNVVTLIDSRVHDEKFYLIQAGFKKSVFFDKYVGRRTFTEDDTRGVAK